MIIVLREVALSDGVKLTKWRNSLKVVRHCIDKTEITEETNRRFYEEMIATGKYKQFIVESLDEQFGGIFSYQIGTVYFKDIDSENRKCELGMFPSDDDEWNSEGQVIAVKQMIFKAFNEMGMHKIYAYVFSDCTEEIELLQSCGFKTEGIFKEEIFDQEEYRDITRLSIIKQ